MKLPYTKLKIYDKLHRAISFNPLLCVWFKKKKKGEEKKFKNFHFKIHFMTKKEFEQNEKPLVMIVSFDPVKGKCIWDYYDWDGTDFWLNSIKKDFPLFHTFMVKNESAIKALKKSHGLTV